MGKLLRFRGVYRCTVDHKGRVTIPMAFRKMLAPEGNGILVLTKGYDGAIEVHPLSEWEKFEDEFLLSLSYSKRQARRFIRSRASFATEVQMDNQGRIMIPKALKEYAKIENEIVIAGTITHFEIWEPKYFENFIKESEKFQEEDSENLEKLIRKKE